MAIRDSQDALVVSATTPSKVRDSQDALVVSVTTPSKVRDSQCAIIVSIPVNPNMSITYPLVLPASPAPRTFKMTAVNLVGITTSPFTGQSQVLQWPGEWWELEVGLPPMTRSTAEQWVAFLAALRGQVGSFLIGDPNALTPQGPGSGSPVVSGTVAAGSYTLTTRGWTHGLSPILKAGDYIQVGSGLTQRLYKSLTDQPSDGSGNATFDVFPAIRETLSDGAAIAVNNTKGCFRLADPRREWDISYARTYGIDFKAKEAI